MRILVIWNSSLKETELEQLRAETGADIIVAKSPEEARAQAPNADVIFGFARGDLLPHAVNTQWTQVPYAGVEGLLRAQWGNPSMILTNGSGIFGKCIAEHILGMLLSFTRGLHVARDHQRQANWHWRYPMRELYGRTVGIVGFGDIGEETAKRLKAFDNYVIGLRSNPAKLSRYADEMLSIKALDTVLPRLDFLVCALPHTEATTGLLTGERLRRLPNHAFVVNVGRGSLFVEEDLVEALQSGTIAGVGLDVTREEPLPADSPLWKMENVILTPHNSGQTPRHWERALDIFVKNWQRFNNGEPMLNTVDYRRGY